MTDSRLGKMKHEQLQRHCCFNHNADAVRDPLFKEDEFFDPHDLLQVKYEMLRSVHTQQRSVRGAAADFGFSRVWFYQMREAFEKRGLSGLLAEKRGPKRRHKLSEEIMRFVYELRAREETISPVVLSQRIRKQFLVTVSPRSIQRALAADKKKLRNEHRESGSAR